MTAYPSPKAMQHNADTVELLHKIRTLYILLEIELEYLCKNDDDGEGNHRERRRIRTLMNGGVIKTKSNGKTIAYFLNLIVWHQFNKLVNH